MAEAPKSEPLTTENYVEIANPWSSPLDISVHMCPGYETVIDKEDKSLTRFSNPFGRADSHLISYFFHARCVPSVEEIIKAFSDKFNLLPAVTQKIMDEFEREL